MSSEYFGRKLEIKTDWSKERCDKAIKAMETLPVTDFVIVDYIPRIIPERENLLNSSEESLNTIRLIGEAIQSSLGVNKEILMQTLIEPRLYKYGCDRETVVRSLDKPISREDIEKLMSKLNEFTQINQELLLLNKEGMQASCLDDAHSAVAYYLRALSLPDFKSPYPIGSSDSTRHNAFSILNYPISMAVMGVDLARKGSDKTVISILKPRKCGKTTLFRSWLIKPKGAYTMKHIRKVKNRLPKWQ